MEQNTLLLWRSKVFMSEVHKLFGFALMTPLGSIIISIFLGDLDFIVFTYTGIIKLVLSCVFAYCGWEFLIRRTFVSIRRLEIEERGVNNV